MKKIKNVGKCYLCNQIVDKKVIKRHLDSCLKVDNSTSLQDDKDEIFYIKVASSNIPYFWLYIEINAKSTLFDLDDFLRDIWLECCGHGSAFNINGKEYLSSTGEIGQFDMDISLDKILEEKMQFEYEYDFGTTSYLTLEVLGKKQGVLQKDKVRILARNEKPPMKCRKCEKPAVQICFECYFDQYPFLCDNCAKTHECEEDMISPYVNSPRTGMCGYIGHE